MQQGRRCLLKQKPEAPKNRSRKSPLNHDHITIPPNLFPT
jgi:hypothetical protein